MEDSQLFPELNLKLEDLLEAMTKEGEEIIMVEQDLKIIWANSNFQEKVRKLGEAKGDIKGKFCYQVYQNKDKPCENCPTLETFKTGEIKETKQSIPDPLGNKRLVKLISRPVKKASGEVIAVIESIIDLSERIELEHSLKQIKDELQAIFDGIEDGIFIIDQDYQILRTNRGVLKFLDKRDFSEVLGKKCFIEYFENDKICSNCPAQKAREEAKSCRSTKIYQKKDKSKLILDIAAFPLQNEGEGISRVIVYMKDITDIINLEERVLFTERLTEVGELAAGVAHEIKNPLGNIVAAAQYFLLKQPLNEKSKNYLEIILRNAENANKIIKQLMTFAKPQELSFKVEDVTLSIDCACSLVETKFARQKVDIIKKWPKDIPPILLDSDMLEQAFLNLILNSLDAIPERGGGRLIITAFVAPEQNEVVVSFVDSGKGISPENLDKVCEPFFTTKEAGLGLGLSFVRHAIDCHKGKMSIRSKVGQGTEITIRFPILR